MSSAPPTVLVTGASGLLGRDIIKAFERDGDWKVVGTALSRANPPSIVKLDLQDDAAIKQLLDDVQPKVIVHSAANRFPDKVEADKALAHAVNVAPTRLLASEAASRSIFLIYISTDYVFPGLPGQAPYTTSSPAAPTNAYGQTKYEGEVAVLEQTAQGSTQLPVPAVVLRVPLLYGHCEKDDPSKSAVHPLIDALWKAQTLPPGAPKIKVDDYALRYPTCTEDVGRVCRDIAKLYTSDQNRPDLPRILHFSAEEQYTKYGMCKLFADEILALPMENVVPWDPTKDEGQATATVRPYNTHLDTSVLKHLGIDVSTMNFLAWWYVT
ncbi:dTDP-4-dehydrorhamnose reductase, variant [Verruconis gallopava]|uniref:dTDP-4-dehydrorhamnose reductase, variant n=1 Tax=Verruconis gallopava TaxID=253628 RepID=A0A0D2B828_9PEZI|nr:dTDP-4-dehydrorhamnose reductase, variant [Verruconis gallopava]KIW07384.1 dTDP-4-dehydrorhamnose reductase, variant [Verruconis gallopava]